VDSRVSDTPQGRFPKSTHLLKHSDFQRVYQQGRRHFSGNMTVFYLRTGDLARVGLTVSKTLGGAVDRNRMRRRTREAVRHHLFLLEGMNAGVDMVINPKKTLLQAEFAQISREIERAFKVVRRACESGAASSTASSRTQEARPR
jgi:ribonuclease P protein component